jgi:hypothetical protein
MSLPPLHVEHTRPTSRFDSSRQVEHTRPGKISAVHPGRILASRTSLRRKEIRSTSGRDTLQVEHSRPARTSRMEPLQVKLLQLVRQSQAEAMSSIYSCRSNILDPGGHLGWKLRRLNILDLRGDLVRIPERYFPGRTCSTCEDILDQCFAGQTYSTREDIRPTCGKDTSQVEHTRPARVSAGYLARLLCR